MGYVIQADFTIDFDDGTKARCFAMQPKETKLGNGILPFVTPVLFSEVKVDYHLPPEIFVSEGDPGSIVAKWVERRDGIGGLHHLAFNVKNVEETMATWMEKGYAEFTSEKPMTCEGDPLKQVFTKPSLLTGVIFEFIERGEHGFCSANVQQLMSSTKGFH